MFKIARILFLIVIASQFVSAAHAEEKSIRRYELPGGHGVLEVPVPESWKDELNQPPADLPPTITLRPDSGDEFIVMITPLWSMGEAKNFNSDERVKELVDGDRREMAPGAVEKELVLNSIKGPEAYGYYFMATDKAPKPGEWPYAMRAGVATGDLLLSITMLTHKKDSEAVSDALDMFRNLRQCEENP